MPFATLNLADAVRGDDYEHELDFVDDSTSDPLDVSDWTIAAQLRVFPDDEPFVAFAVDTAGAATGVVILRLTSEQTALLDRAYSWDLQRTDSGKIWTPLRGSFTFVPDVTR